METDIYIGVEAHIRIVLDIVDRLAAIIEAENKKILWEGQMQAVLNNGALQENKLRLYQKFETLAHIIGRMAQNEELKNMQLVQAAVPRILHLRRMITVNSILLQSHIEQQQRLLDSIMAGIETQDAGSASSGSEQSLCR